MASGPVPRCRPRTDLMAPARPSGSAPTRAGSGRPRPSGSSRRTKTRTPSSGSLRHQAYQPRNLHARHPGDVPSERRHRALRRLQDRVDTPEQRGLAGAVAPHQGADAPSSTCSVMSCSTSRLAVSGAQILNCQPTVRSRSSSGSGSGTPRNGAPMIEVMMLMGISEASMVRATVSISSRKVPPRKAAVGISRLWSVPTM